MFQKKTQTHSFDCISIIIIVVIIIIIIIIIIVVIITIIIIIIIIIIIYYSRSCYFLNLFFYIGERIYLNISKSTQSAAGLSALKPNGANRRCLL